LWRGSGNAEIKKLGKQKLKICVYLRPSVAKTKAETKPRPWSLPGGSGFKFIF
jgi:hypothetical protein